MKIRFFVDFWTRTTIMLDVNSMMVNQDLFHIQKFDIPEMFKICFY